MRCVAVRREAGKMFRKIGVKSAGLENTRAMRKRAMA